MRKATQSVVAIMSLGVLAASYKFGVETAALAAANNIASGSTLSNSSSVSETTNTDASANGSSTGSSSNVPSDSGASASNGSNSTSSSSSTSTKTSTKPSGSGTGSSSSPSESSNSGSGANTAAITKTGQAIEYAFGTVQVSVTKTGSTITAIDMVNGSYTRGPADLWTVLINAAVSAQSSNFGNYSRVTYSTDAFKAAMDSALAQF